MSPRDNGDRRSQWTISSKYFLYTFNVLSLVLGVVILALGIYIRAEWTIKYFINELQAYQMWTGPNIMIGSSVLTIFLSFFGCWGTVNENPFILSLFTLLTGATALIGLGGLTYALNHGTLWSAITPWLTDRFTQLVFESRFDARSANVLRIAQEDIGCCGGSGWQDYANHNMEIPYECRNHVTGNMYVFGCGIIFSEYLESLIGWMSGLALLLVVLQFIAMAAAMILRRNVLVEEKQMNSHKSSYTAVRAR